MNVSISALAGRVFSEAILAYDQADTSANVAQINPYKQPSFEYYLFLKNWIDNAQWHMEDVIRNPEIDPAEALLIKRKIDKSNQERTNLVELIDSYFLDQYKDVTPLPSATVNTESPAWAIDRLSILKLKIHNMSLATRRKDVSEETRVACMDKLAILTEQDRDLSTAIDELIEDITTGRKYMKVYKQMKMYNDPNLNPILAGK